MTAPQLRTPPADVSKAVTDDYVKAVNLNRRIITAAQLAQQSLYEMCAGFKEMRDSKLYRELGYTSFEDYCEQETGIKRRQVYNYISVVENLPPDFVHSGAQIGVKKLYLLSTLSEQERAEIADNTDLESTTVRELERQIKELRAEKDKAVAEKSTAEARLQSRDGTIKALGKTKTELESRICELEKEIKDLESRPIEVMPVGIPENCIAISAYENTVKEYNEMMRQKDDEFLAEKRRAYAEKTELEKQLAEVREQLESAKSGDMSDEERAVIEKKIKDKALIGQIFGDVQNRLNDALDVIGRLPESEREKIKGAFKTLLEKCGKLIEGVE